MPQPSRAGGVRAPRPPLALLLLGTLTLGAAAGVLADAMAPSLSATPGASPTLIRAGDARPTVPPSRAAAPAAAASEGAAIPPGNAAAPEVPSGAANTIQPLPAAEPRGLNGEQRRVRQQSLAAVRAEPAVWIGRYLERLTTVRDASGRVLQPGTTDLAQAMGRGPLTISADEAKELFPPFAADNRSRSEHSASVHEASLLLTDLLWRRALQQPPRPPRTLVLFSGGGVASGKTYALTHSAAVLALMGRTQIVQDSTMSDRHRARSRIEQALASGRSVQVIYVFTPIEQAVRWLVERGMRAGRSVSVAAVARSHWRSQATVLALAEEYRSRPEVRIALLVNGIGADGRLRPIEDLRALRSAADPRFPDEARFRRHVAALVAAELQARHRDADPADPSPELEHSLLVVD